MMPSARICQSAFHRLRQYYTKNLMPPGDESPNQRDKETGLRDFHPTMTPKHEPCPFSALYNVLCRPPDFALPHCRNQSDDSHILI